MKAKQAIVVAAGYKNKRTMQTSSPNKRQARPSLRQDFSKRNDQILNEWSLD